MSDVQGANATPFHLFKFNPDDRRSFIGGSDARTIMGSDEAMLVRLWREKRGEIESEDLSDNLIVQLGTVTEDLNRRWYERQTGHTIKHVQRCWRCRIATRCCDFARVCPVRYCWCAAPYRI